MSEDGRTQNSPRSVHNDGTPANGEAAGSRGEASPAGAKGDETAARPSAEELERVRNREPEALTRFFDRYFDRVYSVAYRLLGAREAAEDLTQEVFYKIHRAAHQLDPNRDPGPWVVAIAYNACRDLWRSAGHRLTKKSESIDEPEAQVRLPRAAGTPESELLKSERETLVQAAINQLPDSFRETVILHDYQGLGHEEIAGLLGINQAAARKRYSRALAALGKLLKETLG